MIKHISFDFWDTLFIGNSEYRNSQVKYLSNRFEIEKSRIFEKIKITKDSFDNIGIQSLTCIPPKTQIYFLLDRLIPSKVDVELVDEVSVKFSNLFAEFPPIPLFEIDFFEKLSNQGISSNISCNTGLIQGSDLFGVLFDLELDQYFTIQIYSDQIGHFKPSPFFAARIKNFSNDSEYSEILHVGDNLETDGKLCEYSGIQFYHAEKKNTNFNEILNLL